MRRLCFVLALFFSLLLSGCGSGTSGTISISPKYITLYHGTTQDFTVTFTNCAGSAVRWDIREGAVGGTISRRGNYTAAEKPGVYHLVVSCIDDPALYDVAEITVT